MEDGKIKTEEERMQEIEAVEANVKCMKDFTSPEQLYEELIRSIRKYHPSTDISMIKKAYQIASKAHEGQKRKSGEPYIIHPLCVAIILADLELDKETIVAGLLHDVVEDTVMTTEDLTREFGSEVALLVDGVTKLGQLNYSADKVEVQAENLRKMFLAMAKDIRVILVKLADRLHNMRTAQYWSAPKQKEKARETMDIYAPIAQRLGISKIKIELDDLSLKYLKPEVYYDLVEKINLRKGEREAFVQSIVDEVKTRMEEADIEAEVNGRVKHFFSIYKKMVNQDKTLDQIYDLFAVRIIVDTVKDCYAALGVIHEMYTPIPGRFKDYIAMPKPNMYQSLHTTLIGPKGRPFEIQIRTFEMHRTAEYGIAAHWKYKEASDGKKPVEQQEEEKLSWLRQILEWQRDMSDNKEFLSLLKSDLDLFNENVYCFSPAGDVKTLPRGSSTVDFAYSVHSAVGNKMVGARVNGKLVPIEYEIKNGDRVEIITSQNSKGPSRDWLKIVKSTQAKNKINQWFKQERKEDNILKGKEMLANYAKLKGRTLGEPVSYTHLYDIDVDHLRAPLDEEERSRIEVEDHYTLILVDIPMIEERNDKEWYGTIPMGIVVTDDKIFTVCLEDTPVLSSFMDGRVRNFFTYKRTRFILQILYRNASLYLHYLRIIDKKSDEVEQKLHKSQRNQELIELLELQKSLVYFTTSLRSNEVVLEKLLKVENIKQYPEDTELLEDVIIENKQAIEMTNIYSGILSGTTEAFASIISNNLNIVMKFLATVTIVMSIPTMIFSAYGMNLKSVGMPFADNPMGFLMVILLSLVFSILVAIVFRKKDLF